MSVTYGACEGQEWMGGGGGGGPPPSSDQGCEQKCEQRCEQMCGHAAQAPSPSAP